MQPYWFHRFLAIIGWRRTGLLLHDNPKRFMTIVMNPDPRQRANLLHTLDDRIACEFVRHGTHNDVKISELTHLYDTALMREPVERRSQIYERVYVVASGLGGGTVAAFAPFMMLDTDKVIVGRATIDYVSLGSLRNDDPMTRPKEVIALVRGGVPRSPGTVVGALLNLGDPRVCALIAPVARDLEAGEVRAMMESFGGATAKCMVEFYLDWLEELTDRRDDETEVFAHLVFGLYRLADQRLVQPIIDGPRSFPVPGEGPVWPRVLDPEEFARSIAPRLFDLEQRERAPRFMPHVIRAFGLVPKTPTGETGLMH
jgi:hypothetical protein